VIVYPPRECDFRAEENIIVGNVCLYGAVSVRLAGAAPCTPSPRWRRRLRCTVQCTDAGCDARAPLEARGRRKP